MLESVQRAFQQELAPLGNKASDLGFQSYVFWTYFERRRDLQKIICWQCSGVTCNSRQKAGKEAVFHRNESKVDRKERGGDGARLKADQG